MNNNPENQSINFDKGELTKLWKMIAERYYNDRDEKVDLTSHGNPSTLGHQTVSLIYNDFNSKTRYSVSGISIGSSDGKQKEITKTYFTKHLVGQYDESFRYEYLKRIVFYISGKKNLELIEWLEGNGFNHDSDIINQLPSGLEYLEGYWIGINRNLEEHKYAVCFYEFKIEGAKMHTKREAYSSEIMYEGEAFLQEDSSFMIHLKGRSKGRIKFIMANPKKIQPDMLRCFSSAYSTISPQEPAIVKELLIKLPEHVTLSKGKIYTNQELQKKISSYFNPPYLSMALDELDLFLGNKEEHVFTLEELTQIKQNDVLPIRKRLSKEKVIENLMANYRINYLGEKEKYKRSIVKYHKQEKTNEINAKSFVESVMDEYVLTKIVKYSQNTIQTHPIKYTARTSDGGVDILPLFPFTQDVFSNKKNEPDFRSSNLLIDAYGDTFVSSSTVINEFGKTRELSLEIEESTLKTQIVIDFGAIENFNVSLNTISYHYNEPDEKGGEVQLLPIIDKRMRTLKLLSLDTKNKKMRYDSGFNFDPNNPKLFVIIVEFPMFEGDCFCVSFNLNNT